MNSFYFFLQVHLNAAQSVCHNTMLTLVMTRVFFTQFFLFIVQQNNKLVTVWMNTRHMVPLGENVKSVQTTLLSKQN